MPSSNLPDPDRIPDMTLPDRGKSPPTSGDSPNIKPPAKAPAPWDLPTSVDGWKIGDRVLAPWEPMFCYVGTIQEINKLNVMIQFDDGDAGWVAIDQLRAVSVERGQKMSSRRKMGALFYPGEIQDIRGDEVLVAFDDGGEDWTRIAALRFYRAEDDDTQGARPTKVASNQVFLDSLRKGDRVWAPWVGGALFVGTVHDLRDDQAHVHFDDGDQSWVDVTHLLPFEPTVGMGVMSNWRMGGQYYSGVVTEINGSQLQSIAHPL
ncbi:MAG: hypothetical protein EXR98_09870 [Gemmataceae bacterium]|nr:hypothetical protein [Gemmataceae bacterium]